MSIKDHVAIITGAGRGVGCATALRFPHEAARVVLFSRTPAPLDDVASEIAREGYPVLSVAGDVSSEEEVQAYKRVDTEMLRQAVPHLKAGMTPDNLAGILLFMVGDSGKMLSGTNLEIFSNA